MLFVFLIPSLEISVFYFLNSTQIQRMKMVVVTAGQPLEQRKGALYCDHTGSWWSM